MRAFLIAFAAIVVSAGAYSVFTGRWTAESRRVRREQGDAARVHPLMRIPPPWVYILAYFLGVGAQRLWPIAIQTDGAHKVGLVAGLALIVAGLAAAFSALGIFKISSTTVVPFGTPSTLVTAGPYRFTRNPMYVGLTLIYLGVAATRLEVWPVIVLPLLLAYVNFMVIPMEERRLRDVFGDAYQQYGLRVRRWL